MSILNRLYENLRTSRIESGRSIARQHLLGQSERMLRDAGFSRELLEQGNRAWPWRIEADAAPVTASAPVATPVVEPVGESVAVARSERELTAAMAELDTYSDAELNDLGISRAGIAEAVRHGRPGIDTRVDETEGRIAA